MKKLGVAIIGAGAIAGVHIQAYLNLKEQQVMQYAHILNNHRIHVRKISM